jgi:hypothetical protein
LCLIHNTVAFELMNEIFPQNGQTSRMGTVESPQICGQAPSDVVQFTGNTKKDAKRNIGMRVAPVQSGWPVKPGWFTAFCAPVAANADCARSEGGLRPYNHQRNALPWRAGWRRSFRPGEPHPYDRFPENGRCPRHAVKKRRRPRPPRRAQQITALTMICKVLIGHEGQDRKA